MRIDIIEANKTNNKNKTIIVLLIIIIILGAVFSLKCIETYKKKDISKYAENKIQLGFLESEEIENVNKILMPKYSENSKKQMDNIYDENSKIAYLTFDDGPSQVVTPLVLSVLKEENVKATFFVLGSNVRQNPEIVKKAYLDGHYIANHGYSHNYSKIYKDPENVLQEYLKTEKEIQNALGNSEYSSHLFRFPGGFKGGKYVDIKNKAAKLLNMNDIFYIDWNVLTGDAQGATTKEKILNNLKKHTKGKGNIVVLMHDASSKILTYETLKDVIAFLREEGYMFANFYDIMK